jgi:(4-O-methyl)-D-glucuronate---lignin esterase
MKIAIALGILATFTGGGMALELPDPLVMNDGTPVNTRKDWEQKRRPELKALFQQEMYGQLPPKPKKVDFEVGREHADFLGGKAVLKPVTVSFGSLEAPRIDLLVIAPNDKKKHPTFLVLNFCGNHAIIDDARVPLTRGWMYPSCKGCTNNHATDAARGAQAKDWPVEEIIRRGYALATFCNTDVDSDRANVSDGVYKWLDPSAPPHNRGSIAAWAWGFHRAMDYLVMDKSIDAKRVAALGHSRNGKTALLAAAMDERFALAIPHQAGCGGTAPSRGKVGESVKKINDSFPHWFNTAFKKYNEAPEKLPFDQNCLAALMAPRPVLFSNAVEDQWANPSGQFEVLKAAEPVYKLLKAGSLDAEKMPELGKLVNSKLGYFIRPGQHSMTREDWMVFLEFADKQL